MPHVICVRGKLNGHLTSLLSIYECSVDHVTLWMIHRFIPNAVINFDAWTLMQLSLATITLQLLFSLFVHVWNMTVFLLLTCSGCAKVHLTTSNWVLS